MATYVSPSAPTPVSPPDAILVEEDVEPARQPGRRKGEYAAGGALAGFRIREFSEGSLTLEEEVDSTQLLILFGALFGGLVLSVVAIWLIVTAWGKLDEGGLIRGTRFARVIAGGGMLLIIGGGGVWAFLNVSWKLGTSYRFNRQQGKLVRTRLYGARKESWPLKRIQGVALGHQQQKLAGGDSLESISLSLTGKGPRPVAIMAERSVEAKETPELVALAQLLAHTLEVPLRVEEQLRAGPKRLRRALEGLGK
jgi:hypothetical protein